LSAAPDPEGWIARFREELDGAGRVKLGSINAERRGLHAERARTRQMAGEQERYRTLEQIEAERAAMRHERILVARELGQDQRKGRLGELHEFLMANMKQRVARQRLTVVDPEPDRDWLPRAERAECDRALAELKQRFRGPTTKELVRAELARQEVVDDPHEGVSA